MSTWFWELLAIGAGGVVAVLMVAAPLLQKSHHRKVISRIRREVGEGHYVGAGHAKTALLSVTLILITDEDDIVRRALMMRGMTVFARFGEASDLVGLSLDELRNGEREGPYGKATMAAVRPAVERAELMIQLEKATAAATEHTS